MPFDYDDRAAVTNINNLKRLCQDGYVIRYSTERRTPLFTAERLDGTVLSTQVSITIVCRIVTCIYKHNDLSFYHTQHRLQLLGSIALGVIQG